MAVAALFEDLIESVTIRIQGVLSAAENIILSFAAVTFQIVMLATLFG